MSADCAEIPAATGEDGFAQIGVSSSMARASSRTPAKRQSMSIRCSTAQVSQAENRTADEVRAGDQLQERQGARAQNPTIDPRPRGRGHRM